MATATTLLVLTVTSLHLLCPDHIAHSDEGQSMSLAHYHVVCDCELCPCTVREATLAIKWESIDDTSFQPAAISTDWRFEAKFTDSIRFKQSFVPLDVAPASHLRSQKFTVILI